MIDNGHALTNTRYGARPETGVDSRKCEAMTVRGELCSRRARNLMIFPPLGGYSSFHAALCETHTKIAEVDWQAHCVGLR